MQMTAEEIRQYRDCYFISLVTITHFEQLNMPKENVIKQYREMTYGSSDSAIEQMAFQFTPIEAAEFETM